ncbi:glycoside hydrolase family 28 protein [Carboxylicivirga linearis]|uniref:Glycoside hydrolase family 28 protein n=1 Tax=Carboxylicivirga linearis TaxID=1628157 RepID=A0ABS5JU27_9BACT|nr:glycoside hydrolase family 28 protein [Carboxylicivirga linearis]MBS2098418.1 glycoside hydrolase family 28 protein [Carboxylicivirga linearis]
MLKKSERVALIIIMFLMPLIDASSQIGIINIREEGADHTGKKVCTHIIEEAITNLSNQGGGEVYFPAGQYLTGPIELKSNITLNVGAGAVLKFTDNFDDYLPMIDSRWEGVRVKTFKSNIYAHNATNITLKGRGLIDGSGKKWWDLWWRIKGGEQTNTKWEQIFAEENDSLLQHNEYIKKMGRFLRPTLFMPYECYNVRVEGLTFQNPPFWTLMPVFSENITIDGITILNPDNSPNTDGIDPSSCRNVRINNCHISVGDDCIVIKSGRDEDGRSAARPTENITITNCTMLDGHGGVVIGSEMSGSVRRVTISNCVFQGTDRGIRMKTMRGRGGVVEDIRISNIVMYDIVKDGVMINMHYHETPEEPVSERTPAIKNVFISNIRIKKAKQAVAIYGLKERDASNITFNDVFVSAEKGVYGNYASNIQFNTFQIESKKTEPFKFENSNNIQFRNVTILNPDIDRFGFAFTNCSGLLIKDCFQVESMSNYIKAENTESIYILNNALPGVKNLIEHKNSKVISQDNY